MTQQLFNIGQRTARLIILSFSADNTSDEGRFGNFLVAFYFCFLGVEEKSRRTIMWQLFIIRNSCSCFFISDLFPVRNERIAGFNVRSMRRRRSRREILINYMERRAKETLRFFLTRIIYHRLKYTERLANIKEFSIFWNLWRRRSSQDWLALFFFDSSCWGKNL